MQKSKLPLFETAAMVIGEAITAVIIIAVFMIVNLIKGDPLLHYSVVTGVLLGAAVTIGNFLLLSILTTRAINEALADRGDGEMTDEEAENYAKKYQTKLQSAMTLSYIIRIATMIATLVVAFIFSGVFNSLATIIPIFMLRPILTVTQIIIKRKESKNGQPG